MRASLAGPAVLAVLALAGCTSGPPDPVFLEPVPGVQLNEGQGLTVVIGVADAADAEGLSVELVDDAGTVSEQLVLDASSQARVDLMLDADVTELVATLTDDRDRTAVASLAVDVNALPTAPQVSLEPNPAQTSDALVATAAATDPDDSGELTYAFTWFEDDAPLDVDGDTLPAERTVKDRTYRVEVVASDGRGEGPMASDSLTIGNTAPTVQSVSLSPSTDVTTRDSLTCAWTGDDADGDELTARFAWTADGRPLGTDASTLDLDPALVAPETEITCTVTLTDADGASDQDAAALTLVNTPPVVADLQIDPSADVTTSTALTCSALTTDLDEEVLDVDIVWDVDGVEVGSGPTLALDPGVVQPEDTVACTITARDGYGGQDALATTVEVINTAPELDSVAISPGTDVSTSTTVTCSATVSDADAEDPSLAIAWTVDGASVGTGDTLVLDPETVQPTDELVCTVTATDGYGGTDEDSATVTIQNTPPSVSAVSISPSSGVTSSTRLTCSATVSDADGETPDVEYAWSVDGDALGTGATLDLDPDAVSPESEVVCTVTASDAFGGSDSNTSSVEVENTPPTLTSVSITPSSDTTVGTELTCTAAATDDDGEEPSLTYAWEVDSTSIGSGATLTLDPDDVDPGDTVVCVATATDGYGGSASDTADVDVENSAPSASLSVSPGLAVDADETVVCTLSASDPDEESLTTTLGWTDGGGSSVGSGGTLDLSLEAPSEGDRYTCTGTATDPSGASDTATTTVVVGDRRLAGDLDYSLADAVFSADWTVNFNGFAPADDGSALGFDFDGDGNGDLAMGDDTVLGYTVYGTSQTGGVYLVYGDSTRFTGETDLSTDATMVFGADHGDDAARVAWAGDVDDDGYDDLLIGAYGRSDVASNAGSAFLVLGRSSRSSTLDLASDAALELQGNSAGDLLGRYVTGPADLDGDGYSDLVVGMYGDDTNGSDAGAVVVQYGQASPSGTVKASAADLLIHGVNAGDRVGSAIDAGGDLDGDGTQDLIVGVYKQESAYILLGDSTLSSSYDVDDLDVAIDGSGVSASGTEPTAAGWAVSLRGDYDGDGYDDVIITSPSMRTSSRGDGGAHLVLGGASPAASIDLDADAAVSWIGESGRSLTGRTVVGGGDLDDDGYDDVLLGAPWLDNDASNDGTVYLLYGASSPSGTVDLADAGGRLMGDAASSVLGMDDSLSNLADLDGDGFADFLLRNSKSPECTGDGCVGLFYGG